jgi:Biotin-lipoyl like
MKTELTEDPSVVRERALVELEELASSDVREEAFLASFNQKTESALGAAAIWIWLVNADGRLKPLARDGAKSAEFAITIANRERMQLRDQVLRTKQFVSRVVAAVDGAAPSASNQVLVSPLMANDRIAGVIEAVFRQPLAADELAEAASFLERAGHSFTRYLGWREESNDPEQLRAFWTRFDEVLRRIYSSLDPAEVAARAVNEARSLIGCDRVMIVLGFPRRPFLAASSGVSRPSQRSTLARAVSRLAAMVAATGESLTLAGRSGDLPPQLESVVTDYLAAADSQFVRMIPLLDEPDQVDSRKLWHEGRRPTVVAVMFVEQISDGALSPLQLGRADLFAVHAARALANANEHSRIFLNPARRRLGKIVAALVTDRLWLFVVAVLAIAAAASVLWFVDAPYQIEAKGQLMPAEQRHVYAPLDGQVVRIFVHGGDRVRAGDRLVELHNDRLGTELLVARNELQEKRQVQEALRAQIESLDHRTAGTDEIRLRGQLLRLEVELRGAQKRLESLEQQSASLVVCSPIAGTVVTFAVEDALLNRPIDRGNLLLDVMNVDGDWQLELEIPEKRTGALLAAKERDGDSQWPVRFIVGTAPEQNYEAVLRSVGTTADLSERFGLAVHAVAAISPAALTDPRVGAEVDAKIACGRRRLASVLFGDFIDFARRKLW